MTRKVSSLGEWGLLRRFLPDLRRGMSSRVRLGPGDDAAVVSVRGSLAVTTDILVEGVHFRQRWTSGEDLGHKALAVNLSDLAAMGDVKPAFGLVALGISPRTPVDFVDGFYLGLSRLARKHGFDVVGGDTVRSDRTVVSIAAAGDVVGRLLKRDDARPGDVLMATGTLGDAAAGLRLLEARRTPRLAPRDREFLLRRLRRPEPRLDLAPRLARAGGVTAMMDCSDGFWRSVNILCEASGVGAEVRPERLLLSPALRRWAAAAKTDPVRTALAGGEDYELIFAARPEAARRFERRGWAAAVGTIVKGRGVAVAGRGKKGKVHEFEHF